MRVTDRLRGDESGAILLVTAMALFALIGMVVLVVDVGGLMNLRRKMVMAADAAALAAAQSCGLDQSFDVESQADLLATSNQANAVRDSITTQTCDGSSSGSVAVEYHSDKTLVFAPMLGADDEAPVPAEATAIWGPTGGAAPMPIEFSVNESGDFPCAYQEIGTTCNWWYDNSTDHDLSNNSNWGFMNLESSGAAADDSCPNAGSDDRKEWISGEDRAWIVVGSSGFTYVCVDSGHSNSSWYDALIGQVGKVRYFPVNDPERMVRTSGKEKYAIIGFVALQIDAVMKGNDPEAIGSPGDSGSCRGTESFAPNSVLDLATMGCFTSADSISDLVITTKKGKNTTIYSEGTDYTFDPTTNTVTWSGPNVSDASVSFDWATAGTPGKCGNHSSDPNAVCLVTSWQGVKVAGSLPGGGADFGLRAVRLDG